MCDWFALCTNPAVGVVKHPILAPVPTCQRCVDKLDLTLVLPPRFFIVSERHGLVATADTQAEAEHLGLVACVNTGRTVYVHDRLTEVS